MTKKLIGYFILLLFFGGLLILISILSNIETALTIFGLAIVASGIFIGALHLITSDK